MWKNEQEWGKKYQLACIGICINANGTFVEHHGEFHSMAILQPIGMVPTHRCAGNLNLARAFHFK
jgi:hypothetical protein